MNLPAPRAKLDPHSRIRPRWGLAKIMGRPLGLLKQTRFNLHTAAFVGAAIRIAKAILPLTAYRGMY